jgi:fumarate reductase flavoprotein subunit
VAALPFFGNVPPKGDALRLATAAGAATRDLDRCTVTPFLAQPSFMTIPRMLVEHGAILVNQSGQRFTDEKARAIDVAQAIRTQPGRVGYLVFDERIAQAVGALDPFFGRVLLARTSRRGSSVGMLSKQLELAEGPLGETLQAHPTIGEPYYGIRITGARGPTLGGLSVDMAGRVLSEAGTPVTGLYAVGGAAASVACGEGDLAGMVALSALGLGRLVAQGLTPIVDEG